ncbi:MAG TPA: DoxX family protein [Bacteroidia bacterium]
MIQNKFNLNLIKALKYICAVILLQTLYFKFTAHPDSVLIFTKMGMEPYGRIGLGIMELAASLLLLLPPTTVYGSLLTLGLMSGAIASHLFVLGIEINDDGGKLFLLALITWSCSAVISYIYRNQLIQVIKSKLL